MEIESGEKLQRREEEDVADRLGFLWRKAVDGSGENKREEEAIVYFGGQIVKNDLK